MKHGASLERFKQRKAQLQIEFTIDAQARKEPNCSSANDRCSFSPRKSGSTLQPHLLTYNPLDQFQLHALILSRSQLEAPDVHTGNSQTQSARKPALFINHELCHHIAMLQGAGTHKWTATAAAVERENVREGGNGVCPPPTCNAARPGGTTEWLYDKRGGGGERW